MKLQFKSGHSDKKAPNTAVFLFENEDQALKNRPDLTLFKDSLSPLLEQKQFKGGSLSELPLRQHGGWLLLAGLGREAKFGPARMLEAAAQAVRMALNLNLSELEIVLPPSEILSPEALLEAAAIGAQLALYKQTECKSEPSPKGSLGALRFRIEGLKNGAEVLEKSRIEAEAVMLARRLGDLPANRLYPDSFAKEAAKLAKSLKLKVQVLDEKALAKEKMNLLLAVGIGGAKAPRLVTISYQGGGASQPPLALVGKGVTFDSGGMSLKPAGSMDGMKTDMAGAATVLAVILAAAEMKLPLNLTAVMPLAENMPDGAGFRVGDVIAGRSGKTVEVTNTDAEGRLILADALNWAGDFKPAAIIDVATLTGACVVALGERCAGLFTDDEALRDGLLTAAKAAGENIWPLPLLDDYEEMLKSETGDMVNAPGVPKGGAINAALFLRRFVPAGSRWAHLDIAGPGRTGKPRPGATVGASGFAVRTLLHYLAELPAEADQTKPAARTRNATKPKAPKPAAPAKRRGRKPSAS